MIRKRITAAISALFGRVEPVAETPKPQARRRIDATLMARSRQTIQESKDGEDARIEPYAPPPGVIPAADVQTALAMDSTPYDFVNQVYGGQHFKGYPYLALLSQQPEYRKMSETIAKQMTRKWIKVVSKGDDDNADKVEQMEAALEEFKVREIFAKAIEHDGFFGRGQIYIDVKTPGGKIARADPEELQTPLLIDKAKIAKGSLIGFTNVEPVWTYPALYNSTDPLAPNYYKPATWFVMGKTVHASRLLMFISRAVPDMLKASYNFGGISLSQLAEVSVNNWIRTRDSIADMVHSYSIVGIKTNMASQLSGHSAGGMDILDRLELFNNMRDNRSAFALDMETEEFFMYNVPLSGLSDLQAQAQEQPAAICNIPLIFLLGITPSGLNASADPEITAFYSYIATMQVNLAAPPLDTVFEIIQLHLFGEIDPNIGYEFNPLDEMDEVQLSAIEKTKADTDAVLLNIGAISADDIRERLISDPASGYHSLEGSAPGIEEPDDGADDGSD